MSWWLILALVAGSYGLKALGVTVLGGVAERRLRPVVSLLPPTLFAAMIVLMTFETGGALAIDARLAGVCAGCVAAWRKAPLIVVMAIAMTTAAALRALA